MSRALASSRIATLGAIAVSLVAAVGAIALDLVVLPEHPDPPLSSWWSGVLPGAAMLVPGCLLLWRLPWHPIAVVLVGALNVSSISLTARGEISSGPAQTWHAPDSVRLAKGAELGRFNLGSTVIALFPRGAIVWDERLARGDRVRVGARIGRRVLEQ